MKTISKILSVVLCLSMVIGLFVVGASAAEQTVTLTIPTVSANVEAPTLTTSDGAVTITTDLNGGRNVPIQHTSGQLRIYTDNTLTFTPAAGITLTKIEITTDGSNYQFNDEVDVVGGTLTVNGDNAVITVDAGATSVVCTNHKTTSGKLQLRFKTVTFTYTTGSGSVTPPPATEETTPATEETTPATEATTPVTPPASGDTVTIVSANLGYENGTDVTSVNLGGIATMTLDVGSNSYGNAPKYYDSGAAIRAYTDNIITFTPAAGVTITSIKVTAVAPASGKTYVIDSDVTFVNGSVTVDGNVSTIVPVDGTAAIVLTNTRPSNGQIRMVSIEITYSGEGGSVTPPATEETTPSTEATTPSEPATEATKPSATLAPVAKPVAGTAYKFALVQAKLSKTLYFNGKMDDSGKFFGTTENAAEAVDVYLEAAQGGYYFYFMDGSTKTYLSLEGYLDNNGKQKASVKLTTEATTVFTYSEEAKTFIHTIGDTSFYLGTYGTYNTMSASSTYYITGDKAADVGVSQFVSTFYAPASGSSNTGDTSVISVAAAALVLSVLGGTALILKKKEN